MKHYTTAALLAASATAGCVPMEQASLTYTSKTTMGVGVAVGTQDTPGLDVAIGFKETNVALVPVAVAKYCYKATGAQCQDAIYKMHLIAGGKLDAVESRPVELRIEQIDQELARLTGSQKSDTELLGALRAKLALSDAADAADAELQKLGTANDGDAAEAKAQRAVLGEKSRLRPAGFNASAARADIAKIEATQPAQSSQVDTLREQRAKLTNVLAANSNSKRNDSYSVYGKFSGGANGNNQGAGLTAGKVFATGVAAQNLTEFAATADCLNNIRSLAELMPADKATEKAALLASAPQLCRPGT